VATVRCTMCQTENPVGEEFCRLCHARLPAGPPSDIPSDEASEEVEQGLMPDWLSRLRQEVSGEPSSSPPPSRPKSGDELEWLGEMPQVVGEDKGPPTGEVPEWVGEAPSGAGSEEPKVPEWLARIRAKAHDSGQESGIFERPVIPGEEPGGDRQGIGGAPSAPAFQAARPGEEPEASGSLGLPDWLLTARPDEAPPTVATTGEPERPAWLEGVSDISDKDLPHVPALVFDMDAPPEEPQPDIDLAVISSQVPDWIGDARPAEASDRPQLAPATLPSWLEAMRPVDTFRSVIEFEATEDQAVESAGPLAGLRGVLLAEPVVAMPRPPSGATTRLDVNERQFAQAELLHRLIEEEQREVRPRAAARAPPSLLRWIVGGALLLAAGIPALLGVPSFALPAFAPRDLASLVALVDALPTETPALVVFDYEAGGTGEMEAVAGPLLSHLMQRGAMIATLSTRPGGSVLAERLMATVGAAHNYVRGEDFVHLGYLPGGPAAVQLFAQSPSSAVPVGFLEDESLGSVWESPVLQGVQRLSDFSLLAVVTSGSDDARVWIEQAEPQLGGKPLVAVVSAGSEPLVRPYYESAEPKIEGVLSGLTSATAYEQRLGRPGLAHSRWSSYGLGLLAVEVLIALGAMGGVTALALRPRRS